LIHTDNVRRPSGEKRFRQTWNRAQHQRAGCHERGTNRVSRECLPDVVRRNPHLNPNRIFNVRKVLRDRLTPPAAGD
jgi:hypothetical protein